MTTAATFSLKCETSVGDRVVLVGDLDVLGQWNPHASLAELRTDEHTYPVWSAAIEVPYDSTFEYKFTVISGGGEVQWETDIPNRTLCMGTKPLEVQTAFDSCDTFCNRLQKALLDAPAASLEDGCDQSQLTPVTFWCSCDALAGETLVAVGGHRHLGHWDPRASSVILETDDDDYPWWQATVDIASGTRVEFKFVKVSPQGRFWEIVDNRAFQVPKVPVDVSVTFDDPELDIQEISEMSDSGEQTADDGSTTDAAGVQEDEGFPEREDSDPVESADAATDAATDVAADTHFEELVATLENTAKLPATPDAPDTSAPDEGTPDACTSDESASNSGTSDEGTPSSPADEGTADARTSDDDEGTADEGASDKEGAADEGASDEEDAADEGASDEDDGTADEETSDKDDGTADEGASDKDDGTADEGASADDKQGTPDEDKDTADEGNPDEDEGAAEEGAIDEATPEEAKDTPEEDTPGEGTVDGGTPDELTPDKGETPEDSVVSNVAPPEEEDKQRLPQDEQKQISEPANLQRRRSRGCFSGALHWCSK